MSGDSSTLPEACEASEQLMLGEVPALPHGHCTALPAQILRLSHVALAKQ